MYMKIIGTIRNKIEEWYHSKDIYPPPIEGIIGHRRIVLNPPFLGKSLMIITRFCLNHWEWLITTVIAIVAIIIAIVTIIITIYYKG